MSRPDRSLFECVLRSQETARLRDFLSAYLSTLLAYQPASTIELQDNMPHSWLTHSDINSISAAGQQHHYRPGEVVFTRGDVGDTTIYILSGEIELQFEGGKQSKRLRAGEFLGELTLVVGEHYRTATAVAAADTKLVELNRESLGNLLNSEPRLLFFILRNACAYLLNSEQALIADLQAKNQRLQEALARAIEMQKQLDRQEVLAQTDELTGLYNRRCWNIQLEKVLARLQVSQGGLGMILLDLDGFKPVNDTFGHPTGDVVLQQVSAILKENVRLSDVPCRLGGDEFGIISPDLSAERGQSLAEALRQKIAALPAIAPGSPLQVTSSLGGTLYRSGESAEQFWERADRCLYQAKQSGRNCVVWGD